MTRNRGLPIGWIAAAVFALTAIALGALLLRQEKPVPRVVRFSIEPPAGAAFDTVRPAISPDGENILFAAITAAEGSRVYVHNLATGSMRPLPGAERANAAFWSSDGRSILIARDSKLHRLDLNGGPVQTLQLPLAAGYSAWGPQDIVATLGGGTLYKLHSDGASAVELRKAGPKEAGGLGFPSLVPDSRWVLYNGRSALGAISTTTTLHLGALDDKTDRILFNPDSPAVYAPPGYVLYTRSNVLMARPLDPRRGELRGEAAPVVEGVAVPAGGVLGVFSASNTGALVYFPGTAGSMQQLSWFDRGGKSLGTVAGPGEYTNPALSPDGSRLAVSLREPSAQGRDIWVYDLTRGTSTKLTFDPKDDFNATWSPDGSRISFSSDRRGARDIYVKSASGNGEEELLLESDRNKNVEDWSPDGRTLVYNQAQPQGGNDLFALPLDSRKPQPFLQTSFNEDEAKLSPDGKWIAYRSAESGRSEVYIQPFTDAASRGKWVVSTAGGQEPQWRGDGKELFYSSLGVTARMMAVDIEVKNGAILAGIPHALFEMNLTTGGRNRWVVTRDGKRFLVLTPVDQKPASGLNVILNWPSLLRK
jgi:Tol biopolymer transport system component